MFAEDYRIGWAWGMTLVTTSLEVLGLVTVMICEKPSQAHSSGCIHNKMQTQGKRKMRPKLKVLSLKYNIFLNMFDSANRFKDIELTLVNSVPPDVENVRIEHF